MIFKNKKNLFLLATLFVVGVFIFPLISSAQTIVPQIEGLTTADIRVAAGSIIQLFLGLLGLIALVIVLYAGFVWMTSGGNEEKISQAKKILSAGVIGLMIILSAYAITTFILNEIQGALTGGNTTPQTCSEDICYGCNRCDANNNLAYDDTCDGCSNSGGGGFDLEAIWHSPTGNDVSLCSMIQVKFNAQIDIASMIPENFKLYECLTYDQINNQCTNIGNPPNNLTDELGSEFTLSSSGKIIKFMLGEDYKENTYYVIDLPINGIKQDGEEEYLSTSLEWTFKTGDETDIDPPTVINVFPDSQDVCLNSYIEIEFSEDMDLDSLEQTEAFRLYKDLLNTSTSLSDVEFIHDARNQKLIVRPDMNYIANHDYYPLLERDIIKDTCGNPLDGNFDGAIQADNTDDYPTSGPSATWTFKTGQNEYCDPQITDISPGDTYYDSITPLTITGYYLSGGTTLVFDDNVVVNETDNLCLDSSPSSLHWPNASCANGTWQSDEIQIFVPADGGDSIGAKAGNVSVKVQTDQGSTTGTFDLLSPRINNLSPDTGGKGQYITISGKNFGDEGDIDFTEAEIYFRSNSGEYIEAELPCGQEGWQDDHIIITAPDILDLDNNPYRVQVKKVLDNTEVYWSNLIDFIVTDDEIGPGLCSIDVEELEYNDQFVLSGFQLGDIDSNRKVVLGDNYNSTESIGTIWSDPDVSGQDTTASAIAPNLSSANNVGVRVAVEDANGDLKFSNYLNVDFTSDSAGGFYIGSISPTTGPVGSYVEILGSGFGNNKTSDRTVNFFSNTAGGLEGDFNFPTACSNIYWQDNKIIVKVPEGFNNLSFDPVTFTFDSKIKVVVDGEETDDVPFVVNKDGLTPSICSVYPEIGILGQELEIAGEYFEDVDEITFAYGTTEATHVTPGSIEEELIKVDVPETETGLISAYNDNGYGNTWNFEYLGVVVEPDDVWSFYGWAFNTCENCESPRVRIQPCNSSVGFSPSPASGNRYVPIGSDIYVAFEYPSDGSNAEIEGTTLTKDNFILSKCGNAEDSIGTCAAVDQSEYTITSATNPTFSSIVGFNFEAAYWYEIELTSDIKDVEGSSLEEESWYFRIDPYGAVCKPDTLNIVPNNFVKEYVALDDIEYAGLLVDSSNCYVCNNDILGYDYEWESSDVSLATIDNLNTWETDVILNSTYNIGSLKIKATSTLDSLELYDDTNLYITANCSFYDGNEDECLDEIDTYHSNFDCCWDDYNNACENTGSQICNNPFVRNRNCNVVGFGGNPVLASPSPQEDTEYAVTDSHIYAEFVKSNVSVDMDDTTFAGGITILNCGTGASPSSCSSSNIPTIDVLNIGSGANFVNYSHSGFLENTWYRITLENSIADIYGNPIIPRTWEFKTDTGICETENISLQPSSATLEINGSKNYGVLCYDSSCNVCDDTYTYDWSIDDVTIATIDTSDHTSDNIAQAGAILGDTIVRVENRELSLPASSELEVILGSGSGNQCNSYNDLDQCNDTSDTYHPSFDCCWDGSVCQEGASNPACIPELTCNDYGNSIDCFDNGCCYDNNSVCTSVMTDCNADCSVYPDESTCTASTCCWEVGDCYFLNDPICSIDMEVLSNYPEDGDVDICPNTLIQAKFDMPIDRSTLEDNVILYPVLNPTNVVTTTYSTFLDIDGKGVLNIYIEDMLATSTEYGIELTGNQGGIESIYGNELISDDIWYFTTANSICDLNYVKIVEPAEDYYEFNGPNQTYPFVAQGRTISGNPIVPITGIYDWQWKWESFDESLVTLDPLDSILTTATSANNNGTTRVKVTAYQIPEESICNTYNNDIDCGDNGCCWDDNGVCISDLEASATCEANLDFYNNKAGYKGPALSDEVEVELFMCENPWEFIDGDFNFRLKYCMDGGLPYLATTTPSLIIRKYEDGDFNTQEIADGLLREYIFKYIDPLVVRNNSNNINLVDVRVEESLLSEVGVSGLTDNRLSFKLLAKMFNNFISGFFNEKVLAQVIEIPTDILGLRIYENFEHRSPSDWYRSSNAVTFQGAPTPIVIDGYSGLQDGRTVYVNAATYVHNSLIPTPNANIYTNVSLLSYNQNAGSETANIFNQLINDWTFNINVGADVKDKIIQDVMRWQDLRTMEAKLDNYAFQNKYCAYVTDPDGGVCSDYPIDYYHFDIDGSGSVIDAEECYNVSSTVTCNSDSECQNHEMGFDKCVGVYPELNEGTYVQGISTSAWPSWTSALSNQIGSSLPADTINKFFLNEFGECVDPDDLSIVYDEQTCWSVLNETFFCPTGSYIYYYKAGNSYSADERALSFDLYSLFNFGTTNAYLWSGVSTSTPVNSAFSLFNSINIDNSSVCNNQISTTCGNGVPREPGEECELGETKPFCAGYLNEGLVGCRYDCQWFIQPETCLGGCGDEILSPEYDEECEKINGIWDTKIFCENSWNPQLVNCIESGPEACTWPSVDICRYCGNGICDSTYEDADSCYEDCGSCGNGTCDEGEDIYSCHDDCGGWCGDGIVSGPEICDYESSIGDECFTSDGYVGHFLCENDCMSWDIQCSADGICGDGVVNGNELCEPGDIGPQCIRNDNYYGNRVCEPNECSWYEDTLDDDIWCPTTEACGDGILNGHEECESDGIDTNFCTIGCEFNCEADTADDPAGMVATANVSFGSFQNSIDLSTDASGNISTVINLLPARVSGEISMEIEATVGGGGEITMGIVFVSDRSGSMSSQMENLKIAIRGEEVPAGSGIYEGGALESLAENSPNADVALISYSDTVTTDEDFQKVSNNLNQLRNRINTYSANGVTHHKDALEVVIPLFQATNYDRKIMIFMTDGEFNPSNQYAMSQATTLKDMGVDIFSVGLTNDADLISYLNGISSSECECSGTECEEQSGSCSDGVINCRNTANVFEECDGGTECIACAWDDDTNQRNYHTTTGVGLGIMYTAIAESISAGGEVHFNGQSIDLNLIQDPITGVYSGDVVFSTKCGENNIVCEANNSNDNMPLTINLGNEYDFDVTLSNARYDLCPWANSSGFDWEWLPGGPPQPAHFH
jgi:von Willebrand factor type A domain-containing protein/Big-like domain-containing protein/type IV secretion system pilin